MTCFVYRELLNASIKSARADCDGLSLFVALFVFTLKLQAQRHQLEHSDVVRTEGIVELW